MQLLESYSSIRCMQYMPDITVNAKIPEDLIHKLSFDIFRIEFQCLCICPFNFEICGIFETLSAITAISAYTTLCISDSIIITKRESSSQMFSVQVSSALSAYAVSSSGKI